MNTGDDFFLHDRLNHFCAKVVDSFHLGGLEGNFADFGPSARRRPVDLNLNNLALDYFCLLTDSNTDRLSEGLIINRSIFFIAETNAGRMKK